MSIVANQIRCKKCKAVIESFDRHDFVWCACRDENGKPNGVAVDGGKEYLRRVGNVDLIEELSTFDEDKTELFETDEGKKSVEVTSDLIIGMDEPPPEPETLEEKLNKLSPKDRLIYEQKGVIETLKETVALYQERDDLLKEYRETIGRAYEHLLRNEIIREDDVLETCVGDRKFEEEWVALPRGNYDALRTVLGALRKDDD